MRQLGRVVFKTLILVYIVLSAIIYALMFTQLKDPNKATRGLLASVAAFIGTMGLEVLVALVACIMIKGRHVLEAEKSCRRKPGVGDVDDKAIPRVDSHQVED